jgi:hypothetical protein
MNMSQDTRSDNVATGGVKRRTLAVGAAWAVPTVIAAGAAPLVAASDGYVTITSGGDACKLPGASCDINKGYTQPFLVCSTVAYPVTVTMDPNQFLAVNGTNVSITNYFWVGGTGPVLNLAPMATELSSATPSTCNWRWGRARIRAWLAR